MKKNLISILSLTFILAISCESPEISTQTKPEFTKEVGVEISMKDANSWASKFRTSNPENVWAQYASNENLNKILSNKEVNGISITNGIDDAGNEIMLYYPVTKNTNIIEGGIMYSMISGNSNISYSCEGKCNIDYLYSSKQETMVRAEIGLAIEKEASLYDANNWAARYREQNQNGIWSNYIGKEMFFRLFALSDAVGIRFHRGIDKNKEEHIMLVAVNSNGHDIYPGSNPKSRTSSDDGTVINHSTKCPPNCPPL